MLNLKRTMMATGLVSTLFLAACGSDSSDSADTTVPAATQSTAATTDSMADSTTPMAAGDIVVVASSDPQFSTLVAALAAAGLVETLQGPGPFTFFAPTNDAFAALPAGLVDKLLLPENKETLTKILTYHVLASKVMAADVAAGDVATVEGSTIAITTDGGVKVNDANVIVTDVAASNGVIHAIDAVLLPPDVDVSAL